MNTLIEFKYIGYIILILWILGIGLFYSLPQKKLIGTISYLSGILIFAIYLTVLWIHLERPPFRTYGETRLWYAFFLSLVGWIMYFRWKLTAIPGMTLFMSSVFLILTIARPETYDKTLMPALQSPWFVPHVVVYIIGYAVLGGATLVAIYGLVLRYLKQFTSTIINIADNLVYIGFAFLTFGLLFGALWAKEAWGHYWTWDPKETWAFITWLGYLLYMHIRLHNKNKINIALWVLAFAFVVLLICWFGINYLPSAQNSVHTY